MDNINLTYKDVFLFSPYDNRYNNAEIAIEQFKRELRIIPNTFNDWFTNIKRLITPGDLFKHIIVMHGYSGCGKTTFIEWLKEVLEEEGYILDIINPILKGRGLKDGKELIQSSINSRLIENLKDKRLFNLISEKGNCFTTDPEILSENEIIKVREILSLCDEIELIPAEIVKQFIDLLCFRQILIIFIVSCLLDNSPQIDKSYIFCFDNLDEILLEYLTEEMWQDILDVSSKINGMLSCININNINFKNNVAFLMVFREANFAVSSTAQLSNRIRPIYEITDKFVFPDLGKQIIDKRNEFCKNNVTYSSRVSDLFKILSHEPITEDILLPMFNYDARKLSQTCFDLASPKSINGMDRYLCDITERDYKQFSHDLTYGKRGILINGIIRYLSKNNFLGNLAPVRAPDKYKKYCNKARLILTVFSNLSYPNGFPAERDDLISLSPIQFNLLQGFEELKEIITPDEYLGNLMEFFNLEKTGWAHLVTIYGKIPEIVNVKREYNFDKEYFILNKYAKGEFITKKELLKLTGVSLQLNASGYAYLRFIITHFEYFNAYKTRKGQNRWHLDEPLFKQLGFDLKKVKWDFELKINDILTHVDAYCHNMLNYFNDVLRKEYHYNEHRFCLSKFVFKEELSNDDKYQDNKFGFYATRLISSHIQYIETFRHYLLSRIDIFENSDLDERLKINALDFEGTQMYLIEVIQKYLNLNKMFNDPCANYIEKLERLTNEILINKEYEKWIKQ